LKLNLGELGLMDGVWHLAGASVLHPPGARNCMREVIRKEGVLALWGGVGYSFLQSTLGVLCAVGMTPLSKPSA
jgi:hypothetical protein